MQQQKFDENSRTKEGLNFVVFTVPFGSNSIEAVVRYKQRFFPKTWSSQYFRLEDFVFGEDFRTRSIESAFLSSADNVRVHHTNLRLLEYYLREVEFDRGSVCVRLNLSSPCDTTKFLDALNHLAHLLHESLRSRNLAPEYYFKVHEYSTPSERACVYFRTDSEQQSLKYVQMENVEVSKLDFVLNPEALKPSFSKQF